MNFIFCNLQTLKKHVFHLFFFQVRKSSKKHECNFSQASKSESHDFDQAKTGSKSMLLIFCKPKSSKKIVLTFCKLKMGKKHDSYFLQPKESPQT